MTLFTAVYNVVMALRTQTLEEIYFFKHFLNPISTQKVPLNPQSLLMAPSDVQHTVHGLHTTLCYPTFFSLVFQ